MKKKSEEITATPIITKKTPFGRSDGQETRNQIIECAGYLFAENGYDKTTSKSICKKAKVNLAAVNYHFGSRDGLYIAVLEEVHDRLTALDELTKIASSARAPQKKIERFLDFFIASVFEKNNWAVQIWLRELLNPSPFLPRIISTKVLPKFAVITKIFSEYLMYPADDPRLYAAMLNSILPFSFILFGQGHPLAVHIPVKIPKKIFLRQLRRNALTTLQALRNQDSATL